MGMRPSPVGDNKRESITGNTSPSGQVNSGCPLDHGTLCFVCGALWDGITFNY